MARPKKGTEFVCEVCGTTLMVTEEGFGVLEDIVCCERPMTVQAKKGKKTKRGARKKTK